MAAGACGPALGFVTCWFPWGGVRCEPVCSSRCRVVSGDIICETMATAGAYSLFLASSFVRRSHDRSLICRLRLDRNCAIGPVLVTRDGMLSFGPLVHSRVGRMVSATQFQMKKLEPMLRRSWNSLQAIWCLQRLCTRHQQRRWW